MKINVPNKLTISRIVMVPVFMFLYMQTLFDPRIGIPIAAVIFIIAVSTDFFDGYLARKHNQVTTVGKFLDAIADKIICFAGLIVLIPDGTLPHPYGVIAIVIIIAREFLVAAVRQIAAGQNIIIAAGMSGKIKANITYVAIVLGFAVKYLTYFTVPNALTLTFEILFYIAMGLTVLSTVYSGLEYLIKNRKIFIEKKD